MIFLFILNHCLILIYIAFCFKSKNNTLEKLYNSVLNKFKLYMILINFIEF